MFSHPKFINFTVNSSATSRLVEGYHFCEYRVLAGA